MEKAEIPSQSTRSTVFLKKTDEQILVVQKNILFSHQVIDGLKNVDFDLYQKFIEKHKKFLWRSEMEKNDLYKQIIPYLVFTHDNKIFVMKRKSNPSETRLQSKLSIGIGGHIRKKDLDSKSMSNSIIDWSRREFKEEVKYKGKFKFEPLGILNDESNPVGKVHTGFVFLLHGSTENIDIKDEHQEGYMLTFKECMSMYNQMENWSRIILDHLKKSFSV